MVPPWRQRHCVSPAKPEGLQNMNTGVLALDYPVMTSWTPLCLQRRTVKLFALSKHGVKVAVGASINFWVCSFDLVEA